MPTEDSTPTDTAEEAAAPVDSGSAEATPPRPSGPVFRHNGVQFGPKEMPKIESVDFRNPTFLSEGELRRLRSVHLEFVRALTSRLSSSLRSEIALNLGKIGTQPFEQFIESLKCPTQISLFRVNPLNGVGIIEMPPNLAIAMTHRILGGPESEGTPDAYLTEIELALLEDVVALITAEWCEQWRDEGPMNAQLLGHETNARFVQSSAKSVMMLVVTIEVSFGRGESAIQIAVPLSMIEPMMKKMHAARARQNGPQGAVQSPAWRTSYDGIDVPVHAEIIAAQLSVEAVLRLKVGDVIELPASALEATRVRVSGTPRFTARAGQQDGQVAIQITGTNPNSK